jgi:hypothetical protein
VNDHRGKVVQSDENSTAHQHVADVLDLGVRLGSKVHDQAQHSNQERQEDDQHPPAMHAARHRCDTGRKMAKKYFIPRGAFCSHSRMKWTHCDSCKKSGKKPCAVTCPDCGLYWMANEGVRG